MPWSIQQRDGKHCVVKDADGSTVACHDSRTDAIKQQRALYANESRVAAMYAELDERVQEVAQEVALPVYNGSGSRTVPLMPSLEGNPKIDQRLQAAMELISEFTQDPPQPHPIHVTVENDNSGMQALVAALGQITERLMNGEKVSESLVASLQNLVKMPAPVVNVEVPNVTVQPAEITVQAAPIPNITVRPNINLPPQSVTKTITFERDFDGRLTQAEVSEQSE